jgi:hypothetical protein
MRPLIAAFAVLAFAGAAVAEPTPVTVRAVAKDAKFIGDAMGGVAITLTDAKSGKVLAKGLTAGGTGDTAKLVTGPRLRGQPLATTGAAAFNATLDLDKPTLVEATAKGPMGKPDAVVTVRSQMWVLPGKAVGGDGWLIELPGLVIEPTLKTEGGVSVTAKVTLMCGCPISPNSTWDASHYEVIATVMQGDKVVATAPLAYAGTASTFSAVLSGVGKGRYRVILTAHDASTGNTGVAERPLTVG